MIDWEEYTNVDEMALALLLSQRDGGGIMMCALL